jgi:hypothetical protein
VPISPPLNRLRTAASRIARLSGARAEASLYGDFQIFLVEAAQALGHTIGVVPQMADGRLVPDFGLFRGEDHIGWVELKAPEKDLDALRGHDLEQHERARKDLESFILTNGWDWRFFAEGELVGAASFPQDAFRDPEETITPNATDDLSAFLNRAFSRSASEIRTAEEATRLMAHRARGLKAAVLEAMRVPGPVLEGLYLEFEGLVYRSGREFKRSDFADAYAQTVVFGLLLGRLAAQQPLRLETAAAGVHAERHPFLFRCLNIMTDSTLSADLRTLLQEAVTTVNRIAPRAFERSSGGRDPLLYAYEDFFSVYDPEERAARGVYYTPPYVVAYQIAGIQRLLRDEFGFSGLRDADVRFLDPATGTGTYLLGLLEAAAEELETTGAAVDVELAEMVVDRVRAFELMIGPYTVAHQRVATWLQEAGADVGTRLPILLVDTLAEVLAGGVQSRFGPLGDEIAHEREAAEQVKSTEPILVVVGNPPYDRIKREQLGDHWLLDRIQDMIERTPQRDRGQVHPIYDFYVAFWRWALWLVAERASEISGRGMLAYITNRSWIIGRTFGGMRSLFTERCRSLYVLDLGGDLRTSGTQEVDQNVFDVGVGVAIVFAVVDPDAGAEAAVHYARVWGSRAEKEAFLSEPFEPTGFELVDRADPTAPFVPLSWGELDTSPGIEEVFVQHETGVQTSRDALAVGVRADDILTTRPLGGSIGDWSRLKGDERNRVFHTTRTHPEAPGSTPSTDEIRRYAYRPLDYRYIYNDHNFIEWPRPGLQRAFGGSNLALVTIGRGFGYGPAAFPVDALPDLHVFRGFGGSRGIYPLYGEARSARPRGGRRSRAGQLPIEDEVTLAPAISPTVTAWAATTLNEPTPEDIFAYVCAVLGAPSYVIRFEERGLVAERPRVPLTTDAGLATEAVVLGQRLIELWTLKAEPLSDVRWAPGSTAATFGRASYDASLSELSVASRVLQGVTEEAWHFEVSGLRVLVRYLEDRSHLPADRLALDELRRVVSSARGIVALQGELDDLLQRILVGPLNTTSQPPDQE